MRHKPQALFSTTQAQPTSWPSFSRKNSKGSQSQWICPVGGAWEFDFALDGKQLISSWTEFRPNGITAKSSDVYERVSGGPGLLGKWKNIKVEATSETIVISVAAPGQIHYEVPEYKIKVSGPTDGSPIKPVGPTVSKNVYITFRVVNPRTFGYESRLNDLVTGMGTLEVSADGKTLYSVAWTPGKEDEKTKAIYEKE